MKTLFTSVALIIFIAACQPGQTNNKAVTTESPGIPETLKPAPPLAFLDSLSDYSGPDSVFRFPGYQVYAGRINGIHIRLVETSDTSTIVYQRINLDWVITDTLSCPFIFITPIDLNGDNYKDLIITIANSNMAGNNENVCLLFYPGINLFHHNKYFDLPNIKYDKKSKRVITFWVSSGVHPQEKMAYVITNDFLTHKEGVIYEPDDSSQGDFGTVKFYKMKGDVKIVTKKIRGKSEKTFPVFAKAIWDVSEEYGVEDDLHFH